MTITRIPMFLVFLAITLFSAVTHAQPAKEVIVINDATNPVPVTTTGFPRTPFALQLVGTWTKPADECRVSFNVQNDQLLVIESLTVSEPLTGLVKETQIAVVTNTVSVTHFYAKNGGYAKDGDPFGGTSNQLRLYADAGSLVDLLVRGGGPESESCAVSVSGYLISPESPSLGP